MNLNQITLPAMDLCASVAWYVKLGFVLLVDSPAYKRLQAPTGAASLSLAQCASRTGAASAKIYLELESAIELDETVGQLQNKGLVFENQPKDQNWLWREAWTFDPSGNQVCLYFAGNNRLNPPWQVGRGQAND